MTGKLLMMTSVLGSVLAHPTFYQIPEQKTCHDLPVFNSYHFHVLFWQRPNSSQHVQGALRVLDEFKMAFAGILGRPCDGFFHQERLCLYEVDYAAVGPFVTPQWAAFVPRELYAQVMPWIMQNRAGYDVLMHPNSGCVVDDHRNWSAWAGQSWQLDLEILAHEGDRPYPHPDPTRPPSDDALRQTNKYTHLESFEHQV
eukprot:gnl/TRDRNA2_/TRDRNA2_154429_c1_seq1.p1 gnl/TRDRNA2_/TRDRNA2_154429_c1~~gnl/TRDRNA2_/TRDRNA2_154429_c1_seq1.p1  ORF type:complete len:219 (-),score=32.18 gnl/TRDRNA2_/TRDRNA2_154429_c1_seq1:210-806(-)